MKKSLFSLLYLPFLLVACSSSTAFVCNDSSFGKEGVNHAEGICFPKGKVDILKNQTFIVDFMIANRFYFEKDDGTIVCSYGDNFVIYYDVIKVKLLDYSKSVLKEYEVDAVEFSKQENGILSNKHGIKEKNFTLKYSFDFIEIFKNEYDNRIYFNAEYSTKYYDTEKNEDAYETQYGGIGLNFIFKDNFMHLYK